MLQVKTGFIRDFFAVGGRDVASRDMSPRGVQEHATQIFFFKFRCFEIASWTAKSGK